MIGGLALFLSDLMKKQQVAQKKSETGVAMTALQQTVLSIFNDQGACTETLKGMSTTGIPSSGTILSTGIKNRSGTVVLNAGKVNNLLDVKFTLKNPNIPSGTGIRSGNVDVEMEVRKLSNVVVLRKTVKETIPLIVEVDGTNKIVNCRTTLSSQALNIKLEMCANLGGIWNTSTSSCSISNLFQKQCQDSGGTWGGSPAKCSNRRQESCQDLGGTWSASGCSIRNVLQMLRSDITALQTGKADKIHSHNYAAVDHIHNSSSSWKAGLLDCPGNPGYYVIPDTELAAKKAAALAETNLKCQNTTFPDYVWSTELIPNSLSRRLKQPCRCIEQVHCTTAIWRQVDTTAGKCGTALRGVYSSPIDPPLSKCTTLTLKGVTCPPP